VKFFGSALLQPACSVFVSPSVFLFYVYFNFALCISPDLDVLAQASVKFVAGV